MLFMGIGPIWSSSGVENAFAAERKEIMKRLLTTLLLFLGTCCSSVQGAGELDARLFYNFMDGKTEWKTVTLKREGNIHYLRVPKSELPKNIKNVEIHHPHATANAGDDGFYVFCNGMYGKFKERPNGVYRNPHVVMPMFGVKTPQASMTVIATGMRYEIYQMAKISNGVYRVFPRLELNGDEPYDDLAVEFHLLDKSNATYAEMAKVYRKYQLDRKVVRPLKERVKENSELKYASAAVEVRVRMGWKPVPSPIPEQNAENEPEMNVAITFDRFRQIVDEFKKQGVDRAEFCLVGWNIGGHDGRYPQIFPVDPRLGGEEKLREAIRKAQAEGFQIVCHTNYSDAYRASQIGGLWDEEYLRRDKDGKLVTYTTWGGGNMYETCPKCMYERFSKSDFAKLKELGFRGLHYVDVYSTVNPRTCYSPNHPLTKEGFAEWTKKILADTQESFGGFASEGGFDYCISNLDYGLYISFHVPGTKLNPLIDRHVPFWQLVYNGIVLNNPYTAATNYTIKEPSVKLKLIEFGGRPMFYFYSKFKHSGTNWMGDDDLTCATDEELVRSVKAVKEGFDEFEKLKHLQLEFMEGHAKIGKDVYETSFSDGTVIITNYGDTEYDYKGQKAEPMGYLVVK